MISYADNLNYFENRLIYQSRLTGLRSYSLSDFKKDHKKLNPLIMKYVFTDHRYFSESFFPRDFEWVIGVDMLLSTDQLNVVPNSVDDYEWYKEEVVKILTNKLLEFKHTSNLLMISGGIDSQLILALCIENQIPFTGIHITSNMNSLSTQFLIQQQKNYKFNFEIVDISKLNIDFLYEIFYQYVRINPAIAIGTKQLILQTYALSLPKFSQFQNVITGHRAEYIMGAGAPQLVLEVAAEASILELNKKYGTYIRYNIDSSSVNDFKNMWGNYQNWAEHNIKGLGSSTRSYFPMEKVSKKIIVASYLDKTLHELALSLTGDAKIKNLYKLTQLELATQRGFGLPYQYQPIGDIVDYYGLWPFGRDSIPKFCIKEWIRSYYQDIENYVPNWI